MGKEDYRSIGFKIQSLLGLEHPPVAVSFMDSPPQGVKKFNEVVPSGCVFWMKAFEDSFYTVREDHANCNIGSFTHGFLAPSEVSLDDCADIKLFDSTGYFPASSFGGVPRMEKSSAVVAYGPLSSVLFEPDVILMVCNAQQCMLVAEAASPARLMGAPTCATIPMSLNSNEVGISLGCVTSRIRTGMKPTDLVVSVPKAKLIQFLEQLEKRVKANNDVADAVSADLQNRFKVAA